jgi:hypothetical protein
LHSLCLGMGLQSTQQQEAKASRVIIHVISPFGDFSGRFAKSVPYFVRVSRDRRSINRQ